MNKKTVLIIALITVFVHNALGQQFQATHRTTVRLRIRETASLNANTITVLDVGVNVQVLSTGATVTIDGITAPWVRVRTSGGLTGWAFSGYLEILYQTQQPPRQQTQTLMISVTAQELFDAYKNNPVAAEQRFEGKPIRVTGVIRSITSSSVILEARGSFTGVAVVFRDSERNKVARMSRGQRVTAVGYSMDVLGIKLNQAVFE